MFNETEEPKENTNFLPAITDNTLIAIAEQAEKRVDAMNRIKKMALRLTNPHDWVDQNGKPYLQASGAEKVARLFGISWRISEPTKENLEGGHFSYTYRGEFSLAGATIEAIGARSSKDGFFKKYKWEGEAKIELPVSEIDPGDVKKSAYTNLLANGITRLLGIRNLTYDDLQDFAGISKDHVTSVVYKKGGKPQAKPMPKEVVISDTGSPVREAQIKAIHTLLEKLNITDDMAKHEKVSLILSLPEPITSMAKLTKEEASIVIGQLQAEAKAARPTPGEPTSPPTTPQPPDGPAPTSGIPTGKVVQNLAELKRLLMAHKIATKEACEILNIISFTELVDLDDAWQKIKQAKNI